MSDKPASPEQIEAARRFGAEIPDNPTHYQCIQAMFVRALREKTPLIITMGTAYDDDMEEQPWRARVNVEGFQDSPQGTRVRCLVEPVQRYLVGSEQQAAGQRLFLIDKIDAVEPAIP